MSTQAQSEVSNNRGPVEYQDAPKIVVEGPRQSPWLLLLAWLSIIALSLAGYFFWQNISLRADLATSSPPPSLPLPTATETPLAEEDQVSTSQTYTDSQFSFEYPLGWGTYQSTGENQTSLFVAPNDRILEIKRLFDSDYGFGGGPFLTLIISPTDKIEEAVNDEYSQTSVSTIFVSGQESQLQTTKITQSSPMGQPGDMLYTIYVPTLDSYLRIQLVDGQYKAEFDQLLKTFKLI